MYKTLAVEISFKGKNNSFYYKPCSAKIKVLAKPFSRIFTNFSPNPNLKTGSSIT